MKRNIAAMIGSTLFILSFVFLHSVIIPNRIAAERDQKNIQQVTLKIDGIRCQSCVKDIRKALLSLPGVRFAEVDYSREEAVVKIEAGKVTDPQLINAVASASNAMYTYRAAVASRK